VKFRRTKPTSRGFHKGEQT